MFSTHTWSVMLWWEVASASVSDERHEGVEVEVERRVAHQEVVHLVHPLGSWIKRRRSHDHQERWNPPVCRDMTTFSSVGSTLLTSVKPLDSSHLLPRCFISIPNRDRVFLEDSNGSLRRSLSAVCEYVHPLKRYQRNSAL